MVVRGGNKLSGALQKIAGGLVRGRVVQVGFMENATYPDGTLVALVAAVQDFGAPSHGIPPRPFFRNMVADKKDAWPGELGVVLRKENMDAEKSLEQMGARIKGQLQESITEFAGVPLRLATVARKGFDKQLIDTGHMLNSVDYRIKT